MKFKPDQGPVERARLLREQSDLLRRVDAGNPGAGRIMSKSFGQDEALTTAWNATKGVAIGAGLYDMAGPQGLAAGGALYGIHKALSYHRHLGAKAAADSVYDIATKAVTTNEATYRSAYNAAAGQHGYSKFSAGVRGVAFSPFKLAAAGAGAGLKAAGRFATNPGTYIGAAQGAAVVGRSAVSGLKYAESLARVALTGGGTRALDAWLPYYRGLPATDMRKFAINPRVGMRLAGLAIGVAAVQTAADIFTNPAPEATHWDDSRRTRTLENMGKDARYSGVLRGTGQGQYIDEVDPRAYAHLSDDVARLAVNSVRGMV